ncbi:motility associated factor glycosyltransferase family protein [Aeromonas salmonicida]|uniref:motility associated factor glycosyltransferase family protein n=1 Tax=Aeromonas salmonicida TaxID=645 RepID=UPI003D204569
MMDFNKKINDIESELIRLELQKTQEAAMLDVLPVRYDLNMTALEKYMPDIYSFFKNYVPERAFRFFCSENGEPNILWLSENKALYGNEPFKDAEGQIEYCLKNNKLQCINFVKDWFVGGRIHIEYNNAIADLKPDITHCDMSLNKFIGFDMPMVVMYGIGLGYQLGYLYEKCKIKNLFAFEPDLDIFYASLFCFDWSALLDYMNQESISLHIFLGVDEKLLVGDMINALSSKGAFWSSAYFSFIHYNSDKINKLVDMVEKEFYLLRSGWGFFDDNIYSLAHSRTHLLNGDLFLKKERNMCFLENIPVFVVGNGPSLDKSITFIKKFSEQAIIIACGSAVSALYKEGVQADIYVAVERTKSSADFLDIMNARDYLREMVFLSVDVIHPDCKAFFRKTGLAFKADEPIYTYLSALSEQKYDTLDYSNPFVGNSGLNYALLLGFQNVYLFGIDNGYKNIETHHSTLSLYYNDKKESKVKSHVEDAFLFPANFGGVAYTNRLFSFSAHRMSQLISEFKDTKCMNCSDGIYIDGTIPVHAEMLNFNSRKIDKKKIVDNILDCGFIKFDTNHLDFDGLLNKPLFIDLIDMLRNDWNDVPRNYNDILSLMQKHHDYLFYIGQTQERHIYRVLIGSINYFYANIITLMLIVSEVESHLFEEKVGRALEALDSFFIEAKEKYLDAFENIDDNYFTGLNVFKHD